MENHKQQDAILKDALQQVTPPDVDESWARMENMLDRSGTGTALPDGSATQSLLRQKIWLSTIFLLITSSVIIGSVLQSGEDSLPVKNEVVMNNEIPMEDRSATNHEAAVAEPETPSVVDVPASNTPAISGGTTFSVPVPANNTPAVSGGTALRALVPVSTFRPEKRDLILLTPKSADGWYLPMGNASGDSILPLYSETSSEFLPVRSLVGRIGLKAAVNFGPGFNYARIPAQTSVGFYMNLGRNPIHSLQLELLYNQLPIRTIQTTQVTPLPVGHTQTDSISIRKLNYISVPILIRYQPINRWSVSFGPQFSILTGLTGDIKTTSTVAGENVKHVDYQHLDGNYNMNPLGIGFVMDLEHTRDRFSYSFRYQFGWTNIGSKNNSLTTNNNTHSNFTFGVAYNLR